MLTIVFEYCSLAAATRICLLKTRRHASAAEWNQIGVLVVLLERDGKQGDREQRDLGGLADAHRRRAVDVDYSASSGSSRRCCRGIAGCSNVVPVDRATVELLQRAEIVLQFFDIVVAVHLAETVQLQRQYVQVEY